MTPLLLLLSIALSRQEGIEAALAADDYAAAWELAEGTADPLARARWRTEILYRGGDPKGALAAARTGLRLDSQHLPLLFRAAGAALWIEDASASADLAARLEEAVARNATLTGEERAGWHEVAGDFRTRSAELGRRTEARERAVARARRISLAGFLLVLAFLGWNVRGYGRSSRPVS